MTGVHTQPAAATTIACPAGFTAGGMSCGIKSSGADDLALILCEPAANAAAVFTRNQVQAAPILLSRGRLHESGGRVRALIINSGCANAATGEEGLCRAARVMDSFAHALECSAAQVLMNSTGVIGEQLPDVRILSALPTLIGSCAPDGIIRAARAIMTTDTRMKVTERVIHHGGRTCRVVGIAKGAGMIHPNMATMIAVIMTDAACSPAALDGMLRQSVEKSFNRISIDGDMSTNDSVFLLASGAAGDFGADLLAPAVDAVANELAEMIVRDGEGSSKLIRVRVIEAANSSEALAVARAIAGSLLVRTSVAGGDPNWGRILAAAGKAGVTFHLSEVFLKVNGLPMFAHGAPAGTRRESLEVAYRADEVEFEFAMGSGAASEEILTCDLTEEYVRVNSHYTT